MVNIPHPLHELIRQELDKYGLSTILEWAKATHPELARVLMSSHYSEIEKQQLIELAEAARKLLDKLNYRYVATWEDEKQLAEPIAVLTEFVEGVARNVASSTRKEIDIRGLFYFAHPYTVKDADGRYVPEAEEANFVLCCQRSARLIEAGFNIYSPIVHTHPMYRASPMLLARHEHKLWYQLDNEIIDKTDWAGIILAPGWIDSKGCRAEKQRFEKRNLPVFQYGAILLSVGKLE